MTPEELNVQLTQIVEGMAFCNPGASVSACGQIRQAFAALEERLQSESEDRRLIAEALDRVAKEKIALEERLRQAEVEDERHLETQARLFGDKLDEKEKHIASLEAELLELNDAYKRTRLASAEKHEQIRVLREALNGMVRFKPPSEDLEEEAKAIKAAEEALAQTEEK